MTVPRVVNYCLSDDAVYLVLYPFPAPELMYRCSSVEANMTERSDVNAAAEHDLPPKTTPPLSPGRTNLNPSDEPGIDDLPHNEQEAPRDISPTPYEEGVPDMDPDNAELDDQPNPR